jgi:LysM repeat protein
MNDAAAASARTTEVKSSSAPLPTIGIDYPSGEFKINDTRVVYIKKGTSYLTIAQRYEIGLARLFEFNDLKPQEIADADQLIYIQRKRKTGDHEFHVVQPGENIYSIAQAEAIRLESLLEYNNLGSAMQPAAGETLYLRSKSPSTPKIVDKRIAAGNQNNSSQTISINNKPDQRQTGFITHSVQPKETLYSIARRYNVSPDDVASWNHLEDFDLKIGQALKIYK